MITMKSCEEKVQDAFYVYFWWFVLLMIVFITQMVAFFILKEMYEDSDASRAL